MQNCKIRQLGIRKNLNAGLLSIIKGQYAGIFCFLIFYTNTPFIWAQYFQQNVSYEIEVNLDDQEHVLECWIGITYKNNAPKSLTQIYMHLWPNAYKNSSTEFARQKLLLDQTDFYFADANELGSIDSLAFTIDGEPVNWSFDKDHPDIAIFELSQPLKPGQQIEISTPFRVKIPKSFSRLGRVDQSYQVTQWYPKPAVYDQTGWHPMPYLDQGEYYSEIGTYSVRITLPANYLVAATGELQSPEEKRWLLQKAKIKSKPASFHVESSSEKKTLHYKAQIVHDFAWFADKTFNVRHSSVELNSGKSVETWAFFQSFQTELWENATEYINRSIRFFSENVGEYPYSQATSVYVPESKGVHMEYPMVTLIGALPDEVTLDQYHAHEIGHNWFYGILASNERDHPWLDEGLSTYYEYRYLKKYYSTYGEQLLPPILSDESYIKDDQLYMLEHARKNKVQAPETSSQNLTESNYYIGAYIKPAYAFSFLEAYLGVEMLDSMMKSYFESWKFKHPNPIDLKNSFGLWYFRI
jgi:hypothetical protein